VHLFQILYLIGLTFRAMLVGGGDRLLRLLTKSHNTGYVQGHINEVCDILAGTRTGRTRHANAKATDLDQYELVASSKAYPKHIAESAGGWDRHQAKAVDAC